MQIRQEIVRALGCPCKIKLLAPSGGHLDEVMHHAIAELVRIETKFSRYRDDSIVSQINAHAGSGKMVEVDSETALLLDYAATAFRESDGLFDITSGILRQAWDFKVPRLPEARQLEDLCKRVGWSKVRWESPRIALPETGMEIDFGGFGKEYAADRVAELCMRAGIRHGFVDLGGDIRVIGPDPMGHGWKLGVCDPREPGRSMASLPLAHGGIATSGDYERFIEVDGERYFHILDPRTGWPVRGALSSVTIVGHHCLVAGTSATIAMLKGTRGPRWLAKLGLPYLWVDSRGVRGGSLWPGEHAAQPRLAVA